MAAIESSAPAPVLTTALFQRFSSRQEDDLANRLLSALRFSSADTSNVREDK